MKTVLFSLLAMIAFTNAAQAASVSATKNEMFITGASVDQVQNITGQNVDVRVFSMSGGDPAMNGALLNVAVFSDVERGWNVFELANVRDYKVLPSAKPGFLKISLTRDTMDADGKIGSARSILFINLKNAQQGTIETEEKK